MIHPAPLSSGAGQLVKRIKYIFLFLAIISGAILATLLFNPSYLESFQTFSENIDPSLRNWTSRLISFQSNDDEKSEPNQADISTELENLDNLIKEYNSAADKSKGILLQYQGDHSSESFTKWIIRKLIDSSFTQNQVVEKTVSLDVKESVANSAGIGEDLQMVERADNKKPVVAEGSRIPKTSLPLVLFSTWIDIPEKRVAQGNVLRTWRLWAPHIKPLVFTNDKNIQQQAKEHGWEVLTRVKRSCGDIPVLREMFRSAMSSYDSSLYGYVNGDLLLGNGLLSTVEALVSNTSMMGKPLMAVIRRINVNFSNRPPLNNVDKLDEIADEGQVMGDGSSDGFFTNRLFPWDHVPDIVPGRLGVAMWLVSYAREMGVQVVDISATVKAVHMTATKGGNKESWGHKNPKCNHEIYGSLQIKPQSWFCGFIHCAQFRTERTTSSGVIIVDKSATNHPRCTECNMDLDKLKSLHY